jgi:hypothetical protein
MVYITHVRFGGAGTAAEDIVMLRWRQSMGDTNVADMIEWIEGGGVAKIHDGGCDHEIRVVRESGRAPYLATSAGVQPIAGLPRF